MHEFKMKTGTLSAIMMPYVFITKSSHRFGTFCNFDAPRNPYVCCFSSIKPHDRTQSWMKINLFTFWAATWRAEHTNHGRSQADNSSLNILRSLKMSFIGVAVRWRAVLCAFVKRSSFSNYNKTVQTKLKARTVRSNKTICSAQAPEDPFSCSWHIKVTQRLHPSNCYQLQGHGHEYWVSITPFSFRLSLPYSIIVHLRLCLNFYPVLFCFLSGYTSLAENTTFSFLSFSISMFFSFILFLILISIYIFPETGASSTCIVWCINASW